MAEATKKSSTWYAYAEEIEIDSLHPSYGYPKSNALIEVNGLNIRNATGLKCMFGETSVKARFISKDRVLCRSPLHVMERNNNKVAVRLASNGERGSVSWKYFEYIQPPTVTSVSPTIGDSSQGGIDITVRGSGFRNVMQLLCSFGDVKVQAKVVDATMLLCPIPPHPPGVVNFRILDEYASYTVVPVENTSQTFQFVPETSIYSVNPTWNETQDETMDFEKIMVGNMFEDLQKVIYKAYDNKHVKILKLAIMGGDRAIAEFLCAYIRLKQLDAISIDVNQPKYLDEVKHDIYLFPTLKSIYIRLV